MSIETIINSKINDLSEIDKKVLAYILENQDTIQLLTLEEISDLVHVSKSSIVRLSQKLGFKGFSEFRYFLKDPSKKKNHIHESNMKNLITDIQSTLSLIQQTKFVEISAKIKQANRVFVFGTGWGEQKAASDLVRNFMSHGVFFVNIPSITELEWNLRHICSEDLIIIISFSGENQELINLVNQLIIRNISICSITPLRQNTLSSLADFKLYYEYSELNFNDKVDSDYN
ncbi:MurR/RpiR family transcriptional regulator, partial [Eremococcus coleocola]|uniref:MurR/RpiR family transcriptional regulator n=1 Tax=Eremococcus coleocola TaxID=88132 RepID=UPI000485975B